MIEIRNGLRAGEYVTVGGKIGHIDNPNPILNYEDIIGWQVIKILKQHIISYELAKDISEEDKELVRKYFNGEFGVKKNDKQ